MRSLKRNPISAVIRRLSQWRWERITSGFAETASRYVPVINERFASQRICIDAMPVGTGTAAYVLSPSCLGEVPIVYSCGVGADISFDLAMVADYGARVWAFDPTAESARFVASERRPEQFHFQQIGIAGQDATMEIQTIKSGSLFYRPATLLDLRKSSRVRTAVPVRSLPTLMEELGHGELDVLKLDIEGAEYQVVEHWPAKWAPARQIVMEWHPGLWNLQEGKPMNAEDGWQATFNAIEKLLGCGYKIFHVSVRGTELSFVRVPR